jgi:adenosylcobinamide-GDP ribazoletransferase
MRWFPAIGALIGAVVGLGDLALATLTTVEVRSIAAVLALLAITGALHMDGLMDACDGLLTFTSPERRLEIMQDSHAGSFAIAGAAGALLLKYTAFLALPSNRRLAAFVTIGTLSRWAMVYAALRYPTARPSGLGHAYKSGLRRRDLVVGTAVAVVAVGVAAGPIGVLVFGLAWAITVVLARYTLSKIPGLTGDVYGAICEIVEVGIAIALPPLWRLQGV